MAIEGHIAIELSRDTHGRFRADLSRSAPVNISRFIEGQMPEEVPGRVASLFALCRNAQGAAAAVAIEAANGSLAPPERVARARSLAVNAECLREHALRILQAWPRLINEPPDISVLKRFLAATTAIDKTLNPNGRLFRPGHQGTDIGLLAERVGALCAEIEAIVLSEPACVWLERRTISELTAWASTVETVAARFTAHIFAEGLADIGKTGTAFLNGIDPAALTGHLFGKDGRVFALAPEWDGAPCETTALARNAGHPLVEAMITQSGRGLGARIVARLVEVARLCEQVAEDARSIDGCAEEAIGGAEAPSWPTGHSSEAGVGIAQVEAARGRLIHGVTLSNGRVERYAIIAPTEWNFHPSGVTADALSDIETDDASGAETKARLLLDCIDPCVAYTLRVH